MTGTLHGKLVYRRLGDTTTVSIWEEKAKLWQHRLALIVTPCLPEQLMDFLQQFFEHQPTLKLPVFYLLAKTHKQGFGLSSSGRNLSRPVVGMHRWATTASSILVATCGTILLKVDRALHLLSAPLSDTINLPGRLRGRPWCSAGAVRA